MTGRGIIIKTRYLPGLFLAAIAILMMFAPYHGDSTLGGNWVRNAIVYSSYVLLAISVLLSVPIIKKEGIRYSSVLFIVPAVIAFIMNVFLNYGDTNASRLVLLSWITFCLLPKDVQLRAFEIFKKIWVVICIVGIFCYACYIFGLPVPYQIVAYYFGSSNLHYISYGISFIYDSGNSLRLCGICNEPGYFGTFCALILCAENLNLKKVSNIIMLIAGFLTFSVAFMLLLVIYIIIKILYAAFKNKNLGKKILLYIVAVGIIFSYIIVLPNIKFGNKMIDNAIQRTVLTSEGISGDDRTSKEFDELYASTPVEELIFGKGRGYVKANNVGSNLSYKVFVIEYGVIGCVLIWGTLLMAALHENTKIKTIVIFIVIFFISIYQRPSIITLPYLLVLIGGIQYLKLDYNNKVLAMENVRK